MSNLTQEIIALEQNRQAIVSAVNAKGGELAEYPQQYEEVESMEGEGDDTE